MEQQSMPSVADPTKWDNAREGGSWLARISLAQVGKWIVDLGGVPPATLKGISTGSVDAGQELPVSGLKALKASIAKNDVPAR
jgi:hypothetical protein